jgi:hypothetical protein
MPSDSFGNEPSTVTGGDLTPLSGASLEAVEAFRGATGPAPGALDGVWTQLNVDIAAGMEPQVSDPLPEGASEAASTGTSSAGTGAVTSASGGVSWGGILAVAGIVALGGVVVALVGGGGSGPEDPKPAYTVSAPVEEDRLVEEDELLVNPASPAVERSEPGVPAALTPEPSPGIAKAGRVAKKSAPAANPRPRASSAETPKPSLADERAMLQRARAALARGEAKRARGILSQYDGAFAAPMLGEERDVLEIRALCQQGANDKAQAHANRFRAKHPMSPHRESLLRSCETP